MGIGEETNSLISVPVKFFVFFFNLFFWIIACLLLGVGCWAYLEKNKFDYPDVNSIFDILFDVSLYLLALGMVVFIVSFAGCLGALRENIFILKFYSYALGVIFMLGIIAGILCFVFSSEVKTQLTDALQSEGITRYREDADFHDLINWIQETFKCCGVGLAGFREWSNNQYFNCSDGNPSNERCGVPYSCCVNQNNIEADIINVQCGYNVQKLSYTEANTIVYVDGCVDKIIKLAQTNLYSVGGVIIGICVPVLVALFLARILANQIEDQRETWV